MTLYAFAQFRFDSTRDALWRDDEDVRLRPQTAQLLHFMLQNPERLISKEELISALWGDSVVNDQAIFQCINQLRKALGEEASNPHFLKTVPRRGYTWICPARIIEPEPEPTPAPEPSIEEMPAAKTATPSQPVHQDEDPPDLDVPHEGEMERGGRGTLVGLGIVLLLCVGFAFFWFTKKPGSTTEGEQHSRIRIAFMPFLNSTGDDTLQWVELGLMDMVVRSFGSRPQVAPVPTDRVLKALKDCGILRGTEIQPEKKEHLREILGAEWVVHVSIDKPEDQFVLSYRAVHSSGRSKLKELAGDNLSDLATLMTSQLNSALQLDEIVPERAFSKDPFVNETYGLGVAELSQGFEARAIPYFEVCLDKDPQFLWAGYQLVRCYMYRGDFEKAKQIASEYLDLAAKKQDRYLEATLLKMMGHLVNHEDSLEQAEQFYRKGLEVWKSQGYDENVSITLVDIGLVLMDQGRNEEAHKAYEEALAISEGLDDEFSSAGIFHMLGIAYIEDEPKRGMDYLEKAFQSYNRLDSFLNAAFVRFAQAQWHYRTGQLEDAKKFSQDALVASRRVQHKPASIQALSLLSEMALEVDDFEASKAYLDEALPWALETGNPYDEITVRLSQAKLAALSGNKDLLYGAGGRAIELAKELKSELYEEDAISHFCEYFILQGNQEAAKTYLDQLWEMQEEEPGPLALLMQARYDYLRSLYKEAYENQMKVKQKWPEIWDSREDRLLADYRKAMDGSK